MNGPKGNAARTAETRLEKAVQWYVTIGQMKYGPMSDRRVARNILKGRIPGDSLVWSEGMNEWVSVRAAPPFAAVWQRVAGNDRSATPPPTPEADEPAQPAPRDRALTRRKYRRKMAVDLKVFLAGTLGAAVLVLLDTLTEFSGGLHFYPELIAIGILGLGSFCRDLVYFAVGREPVQDLSKQRIIPNVAFCIMAVLILALTLTWYVNLRLELRAPEVWFNPTMHCVKRTLLLLWAPIPFKALRQGVRNVVRAFKEGSKW